MSKKKIILFFSLLCVFVFVYLVLNKGITVTQANKQTYAVSVICRSENTETWSTMKLGIDQAAKDMNVDVSFITLSSRNNVKEQVTLLNREVNNGADAVVIAPVNSSELNSPVTESQKKTPVVAMQSTVKNLAGLQTVSCNNVEMGKALAREISKTEKSGSEIVILRNSMNCSNVSDCLRGIQTEMKNRQLVYCDIPDDSTQAYNAARFCLAAHRSAAFIALDAETLEAIGQAKKDMKGNAMQAKIYGAGRTNKIVSLLEQNIINATAVENDYNMGYLCVRSAVDKIRGKDDGNTEINYLMVNSSNMYQSESERMLFPFIR